MLAIVGEGQLAKVVFRQLSKVHEVTCYSGVPKKFSEHTQLVLLLHDNRQTNEYEKMSVHSLPWLRSTIFFGEGIIGPLVQSGVQGCWQCADTRWLLAGHEQKEMWQVQQNVPKVSDVYGSVLGISQLAHLVVEETEKCLQGNESDGIFLLNLRTLAGEWHKIVPVSLCSVCGNLPDDCPELAEISLQPCPKVSSGRSRHLHDFCKTADDYLDSRTGIFNGKMYDLATPFADVAVNLPLFWGNEGVAGRTNSYFSSEMTAMLEGLERYCGITPRGKRTVIRACYDNVKDIALNPQSVGEHEAKQYEQANFPFQKFHGKQMLNWVWGYSFLQEKPILVPERLAYYSLGEGFVYETSNGCAVGSSLEEGILHGIFEVVERDSFLMTWYNRLPLPPLDPTKLAEEELLLMIERVKAVANYHIYFFDGTMEHGIPCIFTVAKNNKNVGLHIICAAGANVNPIKAAKSAVHELAGMMLTFDEKYEGQREKYVAMLADSSLVQNMEDHSLLYGLPEAEERLHFLLAENRPYGSFPSIDESDDVTEDLKNVLAKFRELGLEVIVVNQTAPELKGNGLHCVKVLIPKMLPMTFGQQFTRLQGLERVFTVPVKLGYSKSEQLNPYPHPFP